MKINTAMAISKGLNTDCIKHGNTRVEIPDISFIVSDVFMIMIMMMVVWMMLTMMLMISIGNNDDINFQLLHFS